MDAGPIPGDPEWSGGRVYTDERQAEVAADPEVLYDVICGSAGSSLMFQNRVPHILEDDYTPLSAVDIFVKDLIGEMPYGGGAYIELGPQGAIGRVPPAVSSLNVQADMAQLMDGIHLGGRWPKSRPGEIDQAIASAKFLESSVGMMNTAIRTYHQILQSKLEKALRIACMVDKEYFPGEKTAGGILRNQEFLEEYNPAKDIDMDNRLRVEYGLGMGRDPAQSAVLHIQYSQNEFVS